MVANKSLSAASLADISNGILALWSKGDKGAAIEKTKLYFRHLKDHNDNEDSSIFQLWKNVGRSEMLTAVKEAGNIIDSFGRKLYLDLIALSPGAYSYLTAISNKSNRRC